METMTPYERQRLASDPSTAPDVLAALATDKELLIRGAVALNQKTPISVLTVLIKDESWLVRCYASQHVNLPVGCLDNLSRDDVFQVRVQVARLSRTPETLSFLAKDVHKHVRWGLALNLNSPYGIWLDGLGRILP